MAEHVRRALGPALMALILAAPGCGDAGPTLVTLAGKVSEAGGPVEGAAVMFAPSGGKDAQPAQDTTGPDGSFTLMTGDRSGVVPGKYLVTIVKASPGASEADFMASMAPADPKKAKAKKKAEAAPTQFTFEREVTSQGGSLDFELQKDALTQK